MVEEQPVLTDDDIIRSIREGRTRDYEILVNRYNKRIVNFIHKMIFDYDEAMSLAQDVFVQVFQYLKNYKYQDNFQAFLFVIARNRTYNYIKKHKRMSWFSRFKSDSGKQPEHLFITMDNQQDSMETDEQDAIITEALKSLNENQRLALILKVYLDFSYNKISDITGWTIPKVETLISRAKTNLKKIIAEKNLQEIKHSNVIKERSK